MNNVRGPCSLPPGNPGTPRAAPRRPLALAFPTRRRARRKSGPVSLARPPSDLMNDRSRTQAIGDLGESIRDARGLRPRRTNFDLLLKVKRRVAYFWVRRGSRAPLLGFYPNTVHVPTFTAPVRGGALLALAQAGTKVGRRRVVFDCTFAPHKHAPSLLRRSLELAIR